jgi:hypothetical protein
MASQLSSRLRVEAFETLQLIVHLKMPLSFSGRNERRLRYVVFACKQLSDGPKVGV